MDIEGIHINHEEQCFVEYWMSFLQDKKKNGDAIAYGFPNAFLVNMIEYDFLIHYPFGCNIFLDTISLPIQLHKSRKECITKE